MYNVTMASLSSNLPRTKTDRSTGTSSSSLGKPIGFSRSTASATSHAGHTTYTSSVTSATGPPSTTNPTTNTSNASHVSNISLFLTNLRLLDLDLLPDWPDINTATFSGKDAAQGQKKRIQCVEWALYQLFNLWDPEETRNKLKPFFPPLENVQSLNLRAALVRSLEQAKKNGVLGRDAIVRKTMLDECKGERFEEVLAVFSSAVLKKVVAEQQLHDPQRRHLALAQALALEDRGYSGDRSELTALIVAHRASLCRTLQDKKATRERYRDFSNLLKIKEQTVADRRQRVQASQRRRQDDGKEISNDVKLDVWRTVRNNWSGNERWLETLLHGDKNNRIDGVLSVPFDRVWHRVQTGRISELEDKSDSLLDELDDRVKSQKERLQRWQTFRQQMFGKTSNESESAPQPNPKGIDLGLRGHEALHRGQSARRLTLLKPVTPIELGGEYKELLHDFRSELSNIDPKLSSIPSWLQKPREPSRQESDTEVISNISNYERNLAAAPSRTCRPELTAAEDPSYQSILEKVKSVHDDGELLAHPDTVLAGIPTRSRRSATLSSQHDNDSEAAEGCSRLTRNQQREEATNPAPPQSAVSPPRRRPSLISSKEKQPESLLSSTASSDRPPSLPTEEIHRQYSSHPSPEPRQLADQILASVDAASPSPLNQARHILSLPERTRLTLARCNPQAAANNAGAYSDADGEEDTFFSPVRSASHKRSHTISSPYKASTPGTPGDSHNGARGSGGGGGASTYEDLMTRTRRSMANFESAQKKAQMERRRSERKSKQLAPPPSKGGYFPAMGEEEGEAGEEGNSALLLAEELLSAGQDVDYDAVFRSRPKIARSSTPGV